MRRLLQVLFVLSRTAAALSEGVVLLQTHASIVNSDVGVARSADVVIKSTNDERKSFARRVMDRQGDMAGVKRLYRTYEPVSGPNGDIRMQADAPAFRKEQQQRPNIFFVHNNKCGGSEICYMAQVNGERSPVSPDAWGCETPHKAGEEKIDEARIDMATFVETQGIYPEELEEMKAANDTILMTILRDPVTRVVSEWRHYGYRWDPKLHDTSLREDWTDLDPVKDDMDAMLEYHSTHDPDELSWNVGGANLTEAIKALHAYDLVLITEDLDSTDFARLKTIGWTSQDVVHEDHQNAAEPLVVAKTAGIAALKFALENGSSMAEASQISEDAVEAAGGSPVSDRASVYKYLGPDRVKRIEELFAADVALYRAGVEIAKEQRRVQLPCSIDSSCR
jgi:hypothetical protein